MSGNNKRFSIGWMAGVALGLGSSAALVYAVAIPHTFTSGETASASAVNQNFEALKAAIDALEAAAGTGTDCAGNNVNDEMVLVGSFCIDRHPASLWDNTGTNSTEVTAIPGDCTNEGTGCAGIFAQSRETPWAAIQNTLGWSQAAQACANAGKRLPTAAEWLTAFRNADANLTGITNGKAEWVGTLERPRTASGATDGTAPANAGFIGPGIGPQNNKVPDDQVGFFADLAYNGPGQPWLGFRCAR